MILKKHNYQIIGFYDKSDWKTPQELRSPTSCPKQISSRVRPSCLSLANLQGWGWHDLSGQCATVLDCPTEKKGFQFMSIFSCTLIMDHHPALAEIVRQNVYWEGKDDLEVPGREQAYTFASLCSFSRQCKEEDLGRTVNVCNLGWFLHAEGGKGSCGCSCADTGCDLTMREAKGFSRTSLMIAWL